MLSAVTTRSRKLFQPNWYVMGLRTRLLHSLLIGLAMDGSAVVHEDPRRSLIQAYIQQPRRLAFLKGLGRVVDLYGTLNDNDHVLSAWQASRKGSVLEGIRGLKWGTTLAGLCTKSARAMRGRACFRPSSRGRLGEISGVGDGWG